MKKIVIQLDKSEKIYGCHFCNKVFVKATSLRNHERIHKNSNQIVSKNFNCETCGKKIKSKEKFLDHIEAHKMQTNLEQYLTDRKMFECIKCLNNFEIDLALKHDHKCFECKLCGKLMQVFTLKSHEQRHKKQIENEDQNTKPVKCLKCPKRFKSHLLPIFVALLFDVTSLTDEFEQFRSFVVAQISGFPTLFVLSLFHCLTCKKQKKVIR